MHHTVRFPSQIVTRSDRVDFNLTTAGGSRVGAEDIAQSAVMMEVKMYQHLTKLLPAGVVALALIALGFTLILSPAWADCPHNGNENHRHCTGGGGGGEDVQTLDSLSCTTDQIARYDGAAWICSDAVTDLQAQVDDLLFLASGGRFVFVSSSTHQGDFGGGGSPKRTSYATTWRRPQGYLGCTRLGWLIRTRGAPPHRRSFKHPAHTSFPMGPRWRTIGPT